MVGVGYVNSMRSFTGNAGTMSYTVGIVGAHANVAPPTASNPSGGGGGGAQISLGAEAMGASTCTIALPPLGRFAAANQDCGD